jgi:nitrite reductase/ring-hydroxylating ferredoxin subunit
MAETMVGFANERAVCDSNAVLERGQGLRFSLPELGEHVTGFVIRYKGAVHAYVNRCAHLAVELDWNEGDFFSIDKNYVICATHGAHYQPDTGYCVLGPCKGRSLQPLEVTEHDNKIFIKIDMLKQKA